MNPNAPSPSALCGAVIVDELAELGVTDIVVCPGSRSAPLALAAHAAERDGAIRLWMRTDERAAGFFALGLAKATGRATAVVTTSGTAAANLAPALLEARYSHLPLVAVTADRPATLVATGANQTADQVHLFAGIGQVVRINAADREPGAWRNAVRRAVVAAEGRLSRRPGPVHINAEFPDPLTGDPGVKPPRRPFDCGFAEPVTPHVLDGPVPTVLIAGDMPPALGHYWAEAAAAARVPVFAEPSSNAAHGETAIPRYLDVLPGIAAGLARVVVVGHPTLSRPINALLSRRDLDITVVADTPDWIDPGWAVTAVYPAAELPPSDSLWLATVRAYVPDPKPAPPRSGPITGPALAQAVLEATGAGDVLMAGNSLAIRDLAQAEFPPDPPDIYANRGLAGIDGTIATALGLAAATDKATTLLAGDLTVLHDLTAIAIPELEADLDLRLVVADDGGGNIFRTLEYGSGDPEALERLFTVPPGVNLLAAGLALGASGERVRTLAELDQALSRPWTGRYVIVAELASRT